MNHRDTETPRKRQEKKPEEEGGRASGGAALVAGFPIAAEHLSDSYRARDLVVAE
jgi:hypothetical protein